MSVLKTFEHHLIIDFIVKRQNVWEKFVDKDKKKFIETKFNGHIKIFNDNIQEFITKFENQEMFI